MGLVSALSMAVIERTREVRILRCVGARARIVLGTLTGVLVLTLLVIRGPLRRATRIQPGAAPRYR